MLFETLNSWPTFLKTEVGNKETIHPASLWNDLSFGRSNFIAY